MNQTVPHDDLLDQNLADKAKFQFSVFANEEATFHVIFLASDNLGRVVFTKITTKFVPG